MLANFSQRENYCTFLSLSKCITSEAYLVQAHDAAGKLWGNAGDAWNYKQYVIELRCSKMASLAKGEGVGWPNGDVP